MYASDYGYDARENSRATQLVTACGHSIPEPIRGDVFVGRAHDNEQLAWERVDFTKDDADATADWCRLARASGGGGGQGGAASSLSNLVQQQFGAAAGGGNNKSQQSPQIVAPSRTSGGLYGMDGSPPVSESWGSWTQTSDEVEMKLSVPSTTESKDCKITFKRDRLVVALQGGKEVLVEGNLFGSVTPDECTYTIEDVAGARDLRITLTKADEGKTWSWLTMMSK